jgi:mannitol-1-phosphate/altronate dehydrogenase
MRRTIHRGVVALAIVTSLSVAGARPAAAMDLGLVHQISHLWSFLTGVPSPAAHRTTGKPATRKATSTTTDRGWGIDPNGNSVTIDPSTVTGG